MKNQKTQKKLKMHAIGKIKRKTVKQFHIIFSYLTSKIIIIIAPYFIVKKVISKNTNLAYNIPKFIKEEKS